MASLEEPLGRVLRDFCHVEWYEVDELAALVKSGPAKLDFAALQQQLKGILHSQPDGIALSINALTSNEFESDKEALLWLKEIYTSIFPWA